MGEVKKGGGENFTLESAASSRNTNKEVLLSAKEGRGKDPFLVCYGKGECYVLIAEVRRKKEKNEDVNI